jgi:WD40 repeat protein
LACVNANACTIDLIGLDSHTGRLGCEVVSPQFQLSCPVDGISVINAIGDGRLLCGFTQSVVIRLVDAAAIRESSVFIGHVGRVTHIATITSDLFSSAGEDGSVKLWDLRSGAVPVSDLAIHEVSCLSASSRGLTVGFDGSSIGIVDLRNGFLSPSSGFKTNSYTPMRVCYHEEAQKVFIFGVGFPGRTVSGPADWTGLDPRYLFRCWCNIEI